MHRAVFNLIAAVERNGRNAVTQMCRHGSINEEIESELAAFGYAVALSVGSFGSRRV